MFEENRVLFMWVRMRVVEKFRGMASNFDILPLPKFDESQVDYSTNLSQQLKKWINLFVKKVC